MKNKLRFSALLAALLLILSLPGQAGFFFPDPIVGGIIKEIIATDPPKPTPAPTPAPKTIDLGDLTIPKVPIATKNPFVSTVGPFFEVTFKPIFTPKPATKAPQATPKPPQATPKPTAKPTAKPPAGQKGNNQKGAEVTSFGVYFEELRPKLTDKWYMGTPLDLSQEGVTQYPLVAGNAHIIGNAQVTILSGKLLVNYQAVSGVKVTSEFYTLFNRLDDIQTLSVKLLAPQGRPFGQPIDIAQTFGDDRKVMLYLFLTADYQANGQGITAFNPEQQRPFMQFLMASVD